MRLLVAGGAGFVGSNLCGLLLDRGFDCVCVDNLLTGRRRNIEPFERSPCFQFIKHDVIEELPALPAIDGVIHLASPASPPGYQRYPLETMRVNSEGTMRLLELATERRIPFLFASTSEAYGDPLVHPQTEDYRGNVSSTGPRSMYDESKRYSEALVSLFARTRGTDARIVRIFNTYGSNSDPADGRLVPNFISQALRGDPLTVYGDGQQTRSLCYVADLVEGLLAALFASEARGEVINLGNPEEHTVLEYAEIIIELTKSSSSVSYGPPAVGDDPQRRRPDISKARSMLGWEPKVSLYSGLTATIRSFERELDDVAAAVRS
jgi:dTDP-glucose 4,6-dehydratase/UDP-glucuronate decarboxylase